MPSITIDAGMLAVPQPNATTDKVHDYVDILLDWQKLLKEPWLQLYMSERASEALIQDGSYPVRKRLSQLFSDKQIVEYDVNTVARVVENLLQITPSFEEFYKIRDVLWGRISINPDIRSSSFGEAVRNELERCIVLIAILRSHCKDSVRDHSLVVSHAPQQLISVKALLQIVEHDRNDIDGLPYSPESFTGTVLVCDSFRSLVSNLNEQAILLDATDSIGLDLAIRVSLYKYRLKHGLDPDWDDIKGVRIGSEFQQTLRQCCDAQPKAFVNSVLRAICETIDGQNLRSVHVLRTGAGGGNLQWSRSFDDAKAWRRDIDRQYHLHYWKTPEGSVELASVGVHDNFTIPE